jgi:hypothetical protein
MSDILMVSLSSDYTLTDNGTAQKAFNATSSGTITLPASSAYLLEFEYLITSTGTTSHTWAVLFAGTATWTSNMMTVHGRSGATSLATLTADSSASTTDVTTALVMTAASTSATENVILSGRGTLRVANAGTLIPQVKISTTTNGTPTMKANSWVRLTPIGANTATTLGNWS